MPFFHIFHRKSHITPFPLWHSSGQTPLHWWKTHKICQLNTSWKYKSRDLKFKLHLFIQIIFLIFKEISSLIKTIFPCLPLNVRMNSNRIWTLNRKFYFGTLWKWRLCSVTVYFFLHIWVIISSFHHCYGCMKLYNCSDYGIGC